MKTKLFAIFFIAIILISLLYDKAIAWGPITHMTLLDDMIKDSRLDAATRKILQENLKYAKGGG